MPVKIKIQTTVKVGHTSYKTATRAAEAWAREVYRVFYDKKKHQLKMYPTNDPAWNARNGYDPRYLVGDPNGIQLNTGMTLMQQRAYRRVLPIFKKILK
jgi:hypothetical protein